MSTEGPTKRSHREVSQLQNKPQTSNKRFLELVAALISEMLTHILT